MESILQTHKINKFFNKPVLFHVLRDISLNVYKGEFASIMGKSGCGKSTLCIYFPQWIPNMMGNCS